MKSTLGILALITMGFIVGVAVYSISPEDLQYLVLYNRAVLEGYYYELVTGILVTPSFLDYLLNAVALYVIYTIFGGEAGRQEYVVFFASGVLGNLLTVAFFPPDTMSAGASGGIFGILAYYITKNMVSTRSFSWTGAALLAVVFLSSSIVPYVNYLAHMGGIIGGVVFGLLEPLYSRKSL
ncbi:MAG: rhomboid family intramembrane serine protease [Thermoproteus sp.]